MKTAFVVVFILATPGFGADKTPTVSKEARRHFIKAVTFQKDAKQPSDYDRAVAEYRKALEIAPKWQEARYNLGVALEAQGKYSEAVAEYQEYLKSKPKDAAAVQDKLYALEAKQEEAAARKAEESKARLEGDWLEASGVLFVGLKSSGDGYVIDRWGPALSLPTEPEWDGSRLTFSVYNDRTDERSDLALSFSDDGSKLEGPVISRKCLNAGSGEPGCRWGPAKSSFQTLKKASD